MRRRLTALILVAFAAVAFAPDAPAASYVLKATGSQKGFGEALRIGDFRPPRNPLLAGAVRAWGRPSWFNVPAWGRNNFTGTADACYVGWRTRGVTALFMNLGGQHACSHRFGFAQRVTVYRPRWHTASGLHVGEPVRRLRRVHPRATRHGRHWWLVTAVSLYGSGGRYPVLEAATKRGRVTAFNLWVGAAGE